MQLMSDAELTLLLAQAVKDFWTIRQRQLAKQTSSGTKDQGARGAVTGGMQMNGFIEAMTQVILGSGIEKEAIFHQKALELPGFFRPSKKWDLLVVRNGQLLAVLESKSQVGPSFGNNFNNRTEEAIGSAVDLWTAYREGAFNKSVRPWLGYIFLLENCDKSNQAVKVDEPHFKAFPEFIGASYKKRYELFCRKLVRERHYDAATFLTSHKKAGLKSEYVEPAEDLAFVPFARSLNAHLLAAYGK